MTIYVKETRELRNITLREWNGVEWGGASAEDIMVDFMAAPSLEVPDAAYGLMSPDAARVCEPYARVVSQEALDWWQSEVDAFNSRKRSRLMADEYDCLTEDDIAAYYAGLPADDCYSLDNELLCALPEAEVRRIVADADFRKFLALAGLNQSQCARRFAIPLRTVQSWCGSGAAARECPPYVRLMIAECLGLIGAER